MRELDKKIEYLKSSCNNWLVTGVAGFIGSNLLEFLLKNNQRVVGLDNFATGHQHNLDQVKEAVIDSYKRLFWRTNKTCILSPTVNIPWSDRKKPSCQDQFDAGTFRKILDAEIY